MGSSSSRHGSRPRMHPRPKRSFKRTLSSIFICGSSSSTLPNEFLQTEDDSTEDCDDQGTPTKFQRPRKDFALPSCTGYRLSSRIKNQALLESSVVVNENPSPEALAGTGVDCTSSYRASSSDQDRVLPDPNSSKERIKMSFVGGSDDISERGTQSDQSLQVFEDLLAVANEIPEREVTVDHNSSSETIPSILGLSVSEREQEQRDEIVEHDDVSISSDSLSGATPEINARQLRLDGHRLIWDEFLRQTGERHSESQAFTISSDDSDDSGSGDDLSDDSLDGGARGDGRYLGSQTHDITEDQQRSSTEIWESISRGRDAGGCPSGRHSYGACSCEPTSTAQDGRPHASLSRIVMLAETLFEVLDEIQRQPLSLPLSMVSLPAPHAVVDSLPVKNHKAEHECESDIEQCQICLVEYKGGDEIRVLPCHHEYHRSCVDKWLKEIHRVCPLCRGDVCEPQATVSNPEIPLV